jgi:hypothetical protein
MAAAVALIPKDASWGNNKPVDVLKVAGGLLDAEVAMAAGDMKSATVAFADAAKAEDELAYDEPQPWPLPVREWWGGALLGSGDAAGAEAVYRAELAKHPKSGRALFGLANALKKQGKPAADVEREFNEAWRGADTKLAIAAR